MSRLGRVTERMMGMSDVVWDRHVNSWSHAICNPETLGNPERLGDESECVGLCLANNLRRLADGVTNSD